MASNPVASIRFAMSRISAYEGHHRSDPSAASASRTMPPTFIVGRRYQPADYQPRGRLVRSWKWIGSRSFDRYSPAMSAGNPLLVREFDEAIDVLEAALRRCPEALWEASLWRVERTEP